MINFWQNLKKPIYALAPMAGYTDSAFRQICKDFGADAVYSELASASALFYNPAKTLELLYSAKKEQPYVIQLFGANPRHFAHAVKLLTNKKQLAKFQIPDGIDINFGCPVKKVQKQNAGAVLMDDVKLSRQVIKAVILNTNLPVSLKIRSKAKQVNALKFLDKISDLGVNAVMIHGRTLAQGHSGPVDWRTIKQARNYFSGIILANGGVMSAADARELLEKTQADGVGIARGALGRPWIFSQLTAHNSQLKTQNFIFKVALKHAGLAYKLKGEQGILEMRKHLCWYVSGLENASELRKRLVEIESLGDIKNILKSQANSNTEHSG